jgi:ribulose-5-phosphate 4-epimerase/fuculose-1-phosphate aldolase
MHDEKGYIQFLCDWEQAPSPQGAMLDELRACRDRMNRLGLVGVYPNGIGYGNLSCRPQPGSSFVITGTATGKLSTLGPEHLTEVIAYDVARNWLRCRGPVQASSESLSHAAVYDSDPAIRAIIHVHHMDLWRYLYDKIPTTDPQAEAGTPAMATAIEDLFRAGPVRATGLFVMGGHTEGLVSFGRSVNEAAERLLRPVAGFQNQR